MTELISHPLGILARLERPGRPGMTSRVQSELPHALGLCATTDSLPDPGDVPGFRSSSPLVAEDPFWGFGPALGNSLLSR